MQYNQLPQPTKTSMGTPAQAIATNDEFRIHHMD